MLAFILSLRLRLDGVLAACAWPAAPRTQARSTVTNASGTGQSGTAIIFTPAVQPRLQVLRQQQRGGGRSGKRRAVLLPQSLVQGGCSVGLDGGGVYCGSEAGCSVDEGNGLNLLLESLHLHRAG
eukprot:882366-Rhodomonas_salina.1